MISFILWFLIGNSVLADDFRPLYIELKEIEPYRYTLRVKAPPQNLASNKPSVQFPHFCQPEPRRRVVYRCTEDLAGSLISFSYPSYGVNNSTVVKMVFLSGEKYTLTLSGGVYEWVVPEREEVLSISAQYTWLGTEHIWIGFDHLLFVLCLILIARDIRRILVTITGLSLIHI